MKAFFSAKPPFHEKRTNGIGDLQGRREPGDFHTVATQAK